MIRILLLAASACLVFSVCKKTSSEDKAAVLESASGDVAREEGDGQWHPMALKSWALVGHAVRTGALAEASLRTIDGDRILVEPDTIVRFLRGDQSLRLDVSLGGLILEADEDGARFATRFGEATLLAGGSAELRSSEGQLTLMVRIGELVLDSADGPQRILKPDETLRLNVALGNSFWSQPHPLPTRA